VLEDLFDKTRRQEFDRAIIMFLQLNSKKGESIVLDRKLKI
jgi:hypothetical protein